MVHDDSVAGEQAPWTKEARDYALAGISVVREYRGGAEEYGPEFGQAEVLKEFQRLVPLLAGEGGSDADGLASIASGLTRLGDILLEWIQNDADNKATLLADVRGKFPDYEEPATYPHKQKWSSWRGVLLDIEKTIRTSPTSD
jgi:hypothetical protein